MHDLIFSKKYPLLLCLFIAACAGIMLVLGVDATKRHSPQRPDTQRSRDHDGCTDNKAGILHDKNGQDWRHTDKDRYSRNKSTRIDSIIKNIHALSQSTDLPGCAIRDQWEIRFRSIRALEDFIRQARASGMDAIDSDYALRTVKVRTRDIDLLASLLDDFSKSVEEAGNSYWFQAPPITTSPVRSHGKPTYVPVGPDALYSLGIGTLDASSGTGVTVALIDSGISDIAPIDPSRITSVDLRDTPPSEDTPKSLRAMHGTIMASIIGGQDAQLPGVAPKASFIDVRVLDDQARGDGFTIAKGIVTAVDMGADIINMSIAGMGDDMAVRAAVQYAAQHGVTMVAASGNQGVDQAAYPARYPGVIAVGATDALGQHADFSNSGQAVDISAPGYGVYTALGQDIYVKTDGTSAAAAFVSGTIANVMSEESMPAESATGLVMAYADDSGEPGRDTEFGIGLVDLGRIRDRHEDYVDISTAGYFWAPIEQSEPEAGMPENATLMVSVQNRGTLSAWDVMVEVGINGHAEQHYIAFMEPGQSSSVDTGLTMERLRQEGNAAVSVDVWSTRSHDMHPENNHVTYFLSI